MRKFSVLVCACTALMSGVCSCSDEKEDNPVDNRVALIFPSGNTVARWKDDANYLEDALKSYGYETKLYTAEEDEEGAIQQVGQIEEAIKTGYRTFVITPIDYNKINQSGLLQANQDCNFICYDRMIMDNEAVDFYATCDPVKIGAVQAQFLLNHLHSTGNKKLSIEYFAGPATDRNAVLYYESAYNLLYAAKDIKSLSGKMTYKEVALPAWTAEAAKAEMIARYNDSIPDLILAPNDNVAEGIISALEEKGCSRYPIITGQDLTEAAKKNIMNGKQTMTIFKENEVLARTAAMVVNSYILGSPIRTGKTFNNGKKNVPAVYSDITLITIDNVSYYLQDL